MVDLSLLSNPRILVTVALIFATVIALTMAVSRSLTAPERRQRFSESLAIIATSEMDIDTAVAGSTTQRRGFSEYWHHEVAATGRHVSDPASPGRLVLTLALLGFLIGFLIVPGGLFGGIVGGALAPLVLRLLLRSEQRKRIVAMERQLPQLLTGLRSNLQAGATPQSALMAIADDLPAPLGDEMRILKRDIDVNVPLDTALKALASRVPSREMEFLIASIEIAVRSGADLDPQLATIMDIVKQRTRIRQKLRAAVAQVKPTAWLAYGAVPLMLLVSFRDPQNREFWFTNGIVMLGVVGVLYAAGYLTIKFMITDVENT